MSPYSIMLVAGFYTVILHRVDGGEVVVVPSHVTSMHARAPTGGQNKLVTQEARCVLWLADGKLLSVLEPCDVVKKLMNEASKMICTLSDKRA